MQPVYNLLLLGWRLFSPFQVLAKRQVLKYQWTGVSAAVLTDGVIYDGYPFYHKPCDTEVS
jgi:hypothetical protein